MRALLAGAAVAALVVGCGGDAPRAPGAAPETPPLLLPGPHGDGDSWRDTAGDEPAN